MFLWALYRFWWVYLVFVLGKKISNLFLQATDFLKLCEKSNKL